MKNGSVLKGEVLLPIEDPVKIRTEHGEILAPRGEIDQTWLAAKHLPPPTTPATTPEPLTAAPLDMPLPPEARIQILEAKIATLEATIAALRAELKLVELAKTSPKPKPDPAAKAEQSLTTTAPIPPPPAKPATASSVPTPGGYWLSTDSGIRHNRECRYYMKSKGQPCLQNEGIPCSKCGG